MALTESHMIQLGSTAPDFELPDAFDRMHRLSELKGQKATVVLFICNHCPYVKHIAPALADLASQYASEDEVSFVAINSNDYEQYPDDTPEAMIRESELRGYSFPYLVDHDQSIAKAYDATCTPDIFVYDSELKLCYHGQFDKTRPNNGTATGEDLAQAIQNTVSGQPTTEQRPSVGCNIKWKS